MGFGLNALTISFCLTVVTTVFMAGGLADQLRSLRRQPMVGVVLFPALFGCQFCLHVMQFVYGWQLGSGRIPLTPGTVQAWHTSAYVLGVIMIGRLVLLGLLIAWLWYRQAELRGWQWLVFGAGVAVVVADPTLALPLAGLVRAPICAAILGLLWWQGVTRWWEWPIIVSCVLMMLVAVWFSVPREYVFCIFAWLANGTVLIQAGILVRRKNAWGMRPAFVVTSLISSAAWAWYAQEFDRDWVLKYAAPASFFLVGLVAVLWTWYRIKEQEYQPRSAVRALAVPDSGGCHLNQVLSDEIELFTHQLAPHESVWDRLARSRAVLFGKSLVVEVVETDR